MPFSPWKEHQNVQCGFCVDCGMPIPNEALFVKDGRAHTYSHYYTNGQPVFYKQPAGRHVPCQPSMDK